MICCFFISFVAPALTQKFAKYPFTEGEGDKEGKEGEVEGKEGGEHRKQNSELMTLNAVHPASEVNN